MQEEDPLASESQNLVFLPPNEQVSRGQELLSLLKAKDSSPQRQRQQQQRQQPQLKVPDAAQVLEPHRSSKISFSEEKKEPKVQMTVRRTFIHLECTTPNGSRRRALTDPCSLEDKRLTTDFSDASTDLPSDPDDDSKMRDAFGMTGPCVPVPPLVEAPFPMGWVPAPAAGPLAWADGAWWPADPQVVASQVPWSGDIAMQMPEMGFFLSPPADSMSTIAASYAPEVVAADQNAACGSRTTVMLRNIPSGCMRMDILELLEDEGLSGSFDFLYLPMDFGTQCCLGYAFVNFLSPADAQRCWRIFDGFSDWGRPSEKVCEVSWSDPQQGLQANIERYRNSPVMHPTVPEEWKPLVLQNGAPVQFPPPTKMIKAPKLRTRPEPRPGSGGSGAYEINSARAPRTQNQQYQASLGKW